jgi:hypothetical protein
VTRSELRGNLGRVLAHSTPPPSGHWESQVSLGIAYCGELSRLGVLQRFLCILHLSLSIIRIVHTSEGEEDC